MNVGVIGGYRCSKKESRIAFELGKAIASEGWVLICGGGKGVMESACKGAKEKGGVTVGILPGFDSKEANLHLSVRIPTGLGYARNILVVRASDFLVAVDGKKGTLSEIAFALNENKAVLGIDTWNITGVKKIKGPLEAVKIIKRLAMKKGIK